jgi:putative hydrolase of the HAD superfamily
MRAVILDVGGVLLVPHADSVNEVLAPFDIQLDAEHAQRAHYAGVHSLDGAEEDLRLEGHAYLVGYLEAAGITERDRDRALGGMRELWRRPSLELWRQPVSGSVEALRQLAADGYPLGIVSNADGTIEEQLRRGQICQLGEGLGVPVLAIIDSHVVGIAKPAAAIFRHALEPMGIAPEQATYVGDTVRYDIRGARAAGLHPVHFDPYSLCGARTDHPHIRALTEVGALVTEDG